MIVRTDVGVYKKVADAEDVPLTERKPEDYDLAWSDYYVYVLDEKEWFDPKTSSKYSESGVSRHAMYGPAVITTTPYGGGGLNTHENHVNDPQVWAWIRRSIKEGHLTADSMLDGIDHENQVAFA